ncbi:hypothetical protein J9102_001563 [Vibrio vulnificus]|nr:hypothetical protein [Vibrio vulnificus]
MRNKFGSYIATNYSTIDVYSLLRRLESGRIELYPEFDDHVRGASANHKSSQLIETFLLGLPSSSIWIEQEDYGSSTILEGADIAETLKLFVEDQFRLTGLRYFGHLNGLRFSQIRSSDREDFLSSELLIREVKYDAHPRLKCEFYRNLHQHNRNKNVSQIARSYAFKNAYRCLNEFSFNLTERLNLSMGYNDSRDRGKNEARIHEFSLTVILMLYLENIKPIKNSDDFSDDSLLNEQIFLDDTIEIALDKMMMLIDMGEISTHSYLKKANDVVYDLYSSLDINSVQIKSYPSYKQRALRDDIYSLDEMLEMICNNIFGNRKTKRIFTKKLRVRDYKVSELVE